MVLHEPRAYQSYDAEYKIISKLEIKMGEDIVDIYFFNIPFVEVTPGGNLSCTPPLSSSMRNQ